MNKAYQRVFSAPQLPAELVVYQIKNSVYSNINNADPETPLKTRLRKYHLGKY
jgi:hypothetical protein